MSELLLYLLLFLAGFIFLAGGAELLVRGASRLAATFNVPSVVIGLTVVAFGTSLPELLVSVIANIQGNGGSELAIGNIVGSNIGNLGLILGVAGLMAALPVERHLLRNEYPILTVVTALFVVMAWNGSIDRVEGIMLLIGLVGFTYYSYSAQRGTPEEMEHYVDLASAVDQGVGQPSRRPLVDVGLILVGLVGLVLGARWLIDGAQYIARSFGISELVIGLTLVAVGTSLPELATTVIAVLRKEGDIAVGNVVGSNLFNMLFIGGLSAVIRPLPVPLHMHSIDFPTMIGF
ncbi:MAG: calcium/sodium antiporter, partial [Caldilineaceae bacterium]|nr:calcium/sodium antiporter [Caldilineaceae bacterium]